MVKAFVGFPLAIVMIFSLCATTTDTIETSKNLMTSHDGIVINYARNVVPPVGTLGSQIKSFLKEGKPFIMAIKELNISSRLAWAVYLHERGSIGSIWTLK